MVTEALVCLCNQKSYLRRRWQQMKILERFHWQVRILHEITGKNKTRKKKRKNRKTEKHKKGHKPSAPAGNFINALQHTDERTFLTHIHAFASNTFAAIEVIPYAILHISWQWPLVSQPCLETGQGVITSLYLCLLLLLGLASWWLLRLVRCLMLSHTILLLCFITLNCHRLNLC